jgi:hypothetical protein
MATFDDRFNLLFLPYVKMQLKRFSTHLRILNPAIVLALQLQGMIYHSTDSSGLLAAGLVIISELAGAIIAYIFFNKIYLRQMKIWR